MKDNDNETNEGKYLSHPIEQPKHSLLQHSIDVANKTRELYSYTKFKNPELGFFSGLLHDIGKLNLFYQILFRTNILEREPIKNELSQKYDPVHSPFSAWIAEKLLEKKVGEGVDYEMLDKILMIIFGHHTRHRKSLGKIESSEKFKFTQQSMINNLEGFRDISSAKSEFSGLSWDYCLERFPDPVSFDLELRSVSKDPTDDFLEIAVAYSCLLQADRGSFSDWCPAKFDFTLDTSKLVRESTLSSIRVIFQKELIEKFDYNNPISIINAPTGIGKTKVFLDLAASYFSKFQSLERVFYFSPLLALTEDFEDKLSSTTDRLDDILVYNHLFSGSVEEKNKYESSSDKFYQSGWVFENESFNRPFIITTTQRLLITIFSNNHADRLKLMSFRNSLLIIDEVQTIPKYVLKTLMHILERLFYFLNTRALIVSATIPYELKSIPTASVSNDLINSYLELTKKHVSYEPWSRVNIKEGRTLVMANTRRKAVNIFQNLINKFPDALYLSSGIRKKDRINVLSRISKQQKSKIPLILVSTQVVEAGVDLNFSHIFREKAPLDNIIQVMGRLNREREDEYANLVVFDYDDYDNEHRPYSQLELNESEKVLRVVKDSIELYSMLGQYYESVSERNQTYKNYSKELDQHISRLDFDKVWDFIKRYILEDERDPVLIPDLTDWNKVKGLLMKDRLTKTDYRIFAGITASLPRKVYDLGIVDNFDKDVLTKNILLPKKEYLSQVYDNVLGTDKWLVT